MRLFDRVFKTCITCHFLNKEYIGPVSKPVNYSWSVEEREAGELKCDVHRASNASCNKGVWDEGVGPIDVPAELRKWRGKRCFYIRYSPGMLYPAAGELLKYRTAQSRTRRERVQLLLTIVTCAVVIATFVLSLTSNAD